MASTRGRRQPPGVQQQGLGLRAVNEPGDLEAQRADARLADARHGAPGRTRGAVKRQRGRRLLGLRDLISHGVAAEVWDGHPPPHEAQPGGWSLSGSISSRPNPATQSPAGPAQAAPPGQPEQGSSMGEVTVRYDQRLRAESRAHLELARYGYRNNRSVDGLSGTAHDAVHATHVANPMRAFVYLTTGHSAADRHFKVSARWQGEKEAPHARRGRRRAQGLTDALRLLAPHHGPTDQPTQPGSHETADAAKDHRQDDRPEHGDDRAQRRADGHAEERAHAPPHVAD